MHLLVRLYVRTVLVEQQFCQSVTHVGILWGLQAAVYTSTVAGACNVHSITNFAFEDVLNPVHTYC